MAVCVVVVVTVRFAGCYVIAAEGAQTTSFLPSTHIFWFVTEYPYSQRSCGGGVQRTNTNTWTTTFSAIRHFPHRFPYSITTHNALLSFCVCVCVVCVQLLSAYARAHPSFNFSAKYYTHTRTTKWHTYTHNAYTIAIPFTQTQTWVHSMEYTHTDTTTTIK